MAEGQFDRLELIIGHEGFMALQRSKVAVCGLGGVGSYAVEAISRSESAALPSSISTLCISIISTARSRL